MGLVEVGVGLIPAGGGTKEMLARAMEELPPESDPLPFVQRVFETIGFGKVSTSGPDARRIGYLRNGDGITMNRDRLLADAKASRWRARPATRRSQPRTAIPVGGASVLARAEAGSPSRLAGRAHQRSRRPDRPEARLDPGRRKRGCSRMVHRAKAARPGARGVSQPVRRTKDAGAHRTHAENGKNVEKLKEPSEPLNRREMNVFDEGNGPPVVVVPGLHGRWEWAKPALRELARKCRSVSYSLCGDIGSRWRLDPALGFDNYVRQLEAVLDGRASSARRSAGSHSADTSRCGTHPGSLTVSARSCWRPCLDRNGIPIRSRAVGSTGRGGRRPRSCCRRRCGCGPR